jgi:hypothetical protein
MPNKIKRKSMAVFMNTEPTEETAEYNIVGINIPDLSISYNPKTETQQDITEDTGATEVVGYEPNAPVTQQATKDDAVFEFINDLRRKRAILSDADTDVVIVDIYDEVTEDTGIYKAQKQNVGIQIDSYGGSSAEPLSIGYTINFKGDPVDGEFTLTSKTFDPDAG